MLDSWDLEAHPVSERVLIRVRLSDFYLTAKHSRFLRILYASLGQGATGPVIDVTSGISVLAATVTTLRQELLQGVELFSGGVCGWTQAAWMQHQAGRRVNFRWLLDAEEGCFPSARFAHRGLRKVACLTELQQLLTSGVPAFICASITDSWWLRAMSAPCPHLLCASPPCQPWSAASTGLGLMANDGKLVLHLTNLLRVFRTPLLCLEQVLGFVRHDHWTFIRDLWHGLGYRQIWHSSFDLGDVSPTSRPRFLSVWIRADCLPAKAPPSLPPVLDNRPTLGSFDCIVHGNTPLHQAAIMPAEVLRIYLDRQLVPHTRSADKSGPPAQAYRLRGLSDRAGCLMAQYHFQHELPQHCLKSKGLLGTLLQTPDGPRFHNALEVAMMHVVVRPCFLSRDDRVNMRILGNCLSPVQASLALEHALAAVPDSPPPDPTRIVQACLKHRIRASSHLLVPCSLGWVLAAPEHIPDLIEAWPDKLPWGQIVLPAPMPFRQYWLHDEARLCRLALPPYITLLQALTALGSELPEDLVSSYEATHRPFDWHGVVPQQDVLILEVPSLPALHLNGLFVSNAALAAEVLPHSRFHTSAQPTLPSADGLQQPCLILTEVACFLLDCHEPSTTWGLACIRDLAGVHCGANTHFLWSHPNGLALRDPRLPPAVCVLQTGLEHDLLSTMGCASGDFSCLEILSTEAPLLLQLQSPAAHTLGHSLQLPLYKALGWSPVLLPSGTASAKHLLFRPTSHGLQLPEPLLRDLFADQMVAGALENWSRPCTALDLPVAVEVSVGCRRLWRGSLPSQVTFGAVLELWNQARHVCAVPSQARVYSGPHPLDPSLSLAAAVSPGVASFTNKRGLLSVNLMPEIIGGGAKDDKWAAAQTSLAQLCLEQGLKLAVATDLVDKLMKQAGLGRITRAMQVSHPDHRWEEVRKLCSQFQLALPPADPLSAKAHKRVQEEARRRQAARPAAALAEQFSLIDGFFRNADDTPANVLSTLLPGSSGIVLMNAAQAAASINSFSGTSTDELAIVVLGHECPVPSSCGGRLTFAAKNLASESVLLCGCLHQLGARDIKPSCDHAAEVTVRDCACLAISVYRQHWSDEQTWDSMVRNPVRAIQDRLHEGNTSKVLEAPWGRQYRKASSKALPQECDSIHFKARIALSELDGLLRKSGHNRIFVTPQNWQSEPHPNYTIIWMAGDLDTVCQAALRYPAQLGVTFVKSRYGIRVHQHAYATAFAALRPGETAPARLEIKHTYKLSSVPPGIRSAELTDWAAKLQWQIRPLRQQGPYHWLVGSQSPPPAGLLTLNKQPVLVQEQPARQQQRPVLSAGRATPAAASSSSAGVDPWEQQKDPWSQYLAARAPEVSVHQASAPRALDAPVAKRFDDQEARLSKLEQGLAEVQGAQQQAAAEARDANADLQSQLNATRKETQDFYASFQRTLQENIEGLRTSQSLQQDQLHAGMAELKALLLDQRTPSQKRPASSALPGMDLDG